MIFFPSRLWHLSSLTSHYLTATARVQSHCTNLIFHEQMKHIKMDCHLKDKIQSKTIHLMPTNSNNQVANWFPKPLLLGLFNSLISKLGMLVLKLSFIISCILSFRPLYIQRLVPFIG